MAGAVISRVMRASMSCDALAILDAEGINRCHVVGHSMGGLIAAQLALVSPRRVKSLTFLCTFPDGKSGSRLTWDTFSTGMRTRIGTRRMRRTAFLSLVLSKAGMHDSARGQLEATRYVEIEEAAHAVPIESPSIINQLLVDHLTQITRLVAS